MTKKKKNINTELYLAFIGEFVEMATNVIVSRSEQNEDSVITSNEPLSIQGYLLDIDDEFYYIGSTPDGMSAVIRRENVMLMTITEEENLLEDILNSMDVPTNKEEIN